MRQVQCKSRWAEVIEHAIIGAATFAAVGGILGMLCLLAWGAP